MSDTAYIETAFKLICFAPGPFWLLIIFAPERKWAMRAVDVFLFFLAVHFTTITLPMVPNLLPMIASPTFAGINQLLASPMGTLGSWNHMVLGDLWIGRWVALDTLTRRHGWLLRLCFIPWILFFGPVGLTFYLLYRGLVWRKFALSQN